MFRFWVIKKQGQPIKKMLKSGRLGIRNQFSKTAKNRVFARVKKYFVCNAQNTLKICNAKAGPGSAPYAPESAHLPSTVSVDGLGRSSVPSTIALHIQIRWPSEKEEGLFVVLTQKHQRAVMPQPRQSVVDGLGMYRNNILQPVAPRQSSFDLRIVHDCLLNHLFNVDFAGLAGWAELRVRAGFSRV